MVGKTPQVREIVYNVLDDNGDRTVVAKGATTVDVGDTQQLFTRTTALESLTSDNVSNISDVQSNITVLQNFLGGAVLDQSFEISEIYSPLLLDVVRDHVSNVTRITTLEDVQLSNSLVISNNYSNISFLQDDFYSNIGRIDVLEVIHESNVANINGNFSNISILQEYTDGTFTNVSTLQTSIGAIVNYGPITTLQGNVETLKDRINKAIIKIGAGSGQNDPGGTSISLGQSAGQFIGQNSIGIGAGAQTNSDSTQQGNTKRSIILNATGLPLFAPRSETLVIRPIQTDDSNTINIMGYNETYGEIVQSTLLRGIDGNVHATSNIIVNDGAIIFETNGNGSFGGIVEINSTLEVGGTSSFTGAMQMESTLEVGATSLFVGEMTVHDSVNVHGQSFIVYNGATTKKIILTNEGNGSFGGIVKISSTLDVGGASSFTGAMQMANTLEVGGTSSFTGDVTLGTGADLIMNSESFSMKSGSDENIYIRNNGSASFAGNLNVDSIDCRDNIDVYNSFNMRASGGIKATINKLGVSSFAGAMQIKDTLVVDNTLTIQNSIDSENGKVIIDPSIHTSDCVQIQGGISIYNGVTTDSGSKNASISRSGLGFFASGLTTNGGLTARGNLTIKDSSDPFTDVKATISASDGTASFAGTMEMASTLTVGGTSSFASGMQVAGSGTATSITTGGKISIGSTSSFGGHMEVNGKITASNAGSSFAGLTVGGTSGTTSITTSGDIEGADFIIPSDRRFKTEITHIPNALDKIKQISGCTYKVGDKPSAGVIAQEVLEILPEVVHTREDGYYAVSYHGLIGLLIEAVKELSEKVK